MLSRLRSILGSKEAPASTTQATSLHRTKDPIATLIARANELKAEIGLPPNIDDQVEAAELVVTAIASRILSSDGRVLHPANIDLRDVVIDMAFVCFISVPFINLLDIEDETAANRFLMAVAISLFQFYSEESIPRIFQSGTNLFRKSVTDGDSYASFIKFNDDVHKLALACGLALSAEATEALKSRYSAYRKLVMASA